MPGVGAPLQEAEVVAWLKKAIANQGISGRSVRDIIVDSDSSYLNSPYRGILEPTGTIWINGRRPDLVCLADDGNAERLVGFEVKAHTEHDKGIIQASRYRDGVHEAYLCIPGNDRSPQWLSEAAGQNGIGLLRAFRDGIQVDVPPARLRPDPSTLLATRRYLQGEQSIRSFGLNKPLHYVAAAIAFGTCADPLQVMTNVWGLNNSAVGHAVRGAQILGLLTGDKRATPLALAYFQAFRALGFDLATTRHLTRKRLANHAPGYAALLRTIFLHNDAVQLIVRTLIRCRGREAILSLAKLARTLDEGMAGAIFGVSTQDQDSWVVRPSTRSIFKASLYDIGLLDSPLAPGAMRPQGPAGYDPQRDIWELGKAMTMGNILEARHAL